MNNLLLPNSKDTVVNIHELFEILISSCDVPPRLQDKGFTEVLKNFLIPLIIEKHFDRCQLLLSAGHVADHIYFVIKGLSRGFYIEERSQKEVTDFLWTQHSIIAVPDSFFHKKPSPIFIEVMPQTHLMGISYLHLLDCIKAFPEVNLFSKNIILQHNAYESGRNYDLANLSPWKRYLKLLHRQPDIEQLVPKSIIASFLQITPQSLSRMLRREGHP